MLIRVFTLRFDDQSGGFNDEVVRDFVKDKQVVSMKDHFFLRMDVPHLAIVVQYTMMQPETVVATGDVKKKRSADWRKLLDDSDYPLFNALRDWRAEEAKKGGVPSYIICTNIQLAQMVKERPQTLEQLSEIKGFGRERMKKYGRNILNLLATTTRSSGEVANSKNGVEPDSRQEV